VSDKESVGDTDVNGPIYVARRKHTHALDDDFLSPDKATRAPYRENKESVSHDFTKGTEHREVTEQRRVGTRHRTVVALLCERGNP
jgi:hypothetical protein